MDTVSMYSLDLEVVHTCKANANNIEVMNKWHSIVEKKLLKIIGITKWEFVALLNALQDKSMLFYWDRQNNSGIMVLISQSLKLAILKRKYYWYNYKISCRTKKCLNWGVVVTVRGLEDTKVILNKELTMRYAMRRPKVG